MSYYPPTDWELKDFYREHADVLFRCCYFLTCGEADVQKMVHDIFMRMLTKGIGFSSDKDASAWMMLSAYKMSKKPPLRVVQRSDAEPKAEEKVDTEDIAENPALEQSLDVMDQTDVVSDDNIMPEFPAELRELSRKDRLIAAFYYCEGFRKVEIAKYLGWTTFMVDHRLRRIRKKILRERGGEETC